MPPQQPYQPPVPPVHPPQPPGNGTTPHAPRLGYIPMSEHTQHFERHPSGHYEVVPPYQAGGNDSHTGHNPYEFIVNPNTAGARPKFKLGGDPFIMRIVLILGGVFVVAIVAAVLLSALTPKGSLPGLEAIAERQQEIIRVSTEGVNNATTQPGQNFVTNVQVTMTSSQKNVLSYLAAHGIKMSQSMLALDKDPQTDTALNNAASANNYDGALTQDLTSQLQTYAALLQSTYKQTTDTQAKKLLQTDFVAANLLIKQAQATAAAIQQ